MLIVRIIIYYDEYWLANVFSIRIIIICELKGSIEQTFLFFLQKNLLELHGYFVFIHLLAFV